MDAQLLAPALGVPEALREVAYRELFFRFLVPAIVGTVAALCFPVLVGGERLLPPVVAWGFATYLLGSALLLEVRGKEVFWDFWLVRL
jgi:hypothetical protein